MNGDRVVFARFFVEHLNRRGRFALSLGDRLQFGLGFELLGVPRFIVNDHPFTCIAQWSEIQTCTIDAPPREKTGRLNRIMCLKVAAEECRRRYGTDPLFSTEFAIIESLEMRLRAGEQVREKELTRVGVRLNDLWATFSQQ